MTTAAETIAGMIRAIIADPDDDTLRLVCADAYEDAARLLYADGYDDDGDCQMGRAAFIRLGVELARLEQQADLLSMADISPRDPDWDRVHKPLKKLRQKQRRANWQVLRFLDWPMRHEGGTWSVVHNWPMSPPGEYPQVSFRRGFVDTVRLSADDFIAQIDNLLAAAPIEHVLFSTPLTYGRHWAYIDSDMQIAYLVRGAAKHRYFDVSEFPIEDFGFIEALLRVNFQSIRRWSLHPNNDNQEESYP